MSRPASIVGDVEYREGDGANIAIRKGPCDVEQTELDATISWADEDSRGSAAIPIAAFKRYLARMAIVFVDDAGR